MRLIPYLVLGTLVLTAAAAVLPAPAGQPAPLEPEDLLGWWVDSTATTWFGFLDLEHLWIVQPPDSLCSLVQWEFVSSTDDSIVVHAQGDATQQAVATIVYCSSCACEAEYEVTVTLFDVQINRFCMDRTGGPPVPCGPVPAEPSTWGRLKSRYESGD